MSAACLIALGLARHLGEHSQECAPCGDALAERKRLRDMCAQGRLLALDVADHGLRCALCAPDLRARLQRARLQLMMAEASA